MLREDGPLLALTIEGKKRDGLQPRSEAEVRGVFEDILDDGTLVINGVRVALSILTELEGDPQVGDFVEVKALIQEDGLLLAREVERKAKAGAEELPETNEVEIEGAIDRVNEDGTLLVNGITVVISALSEVRGDLLQGASVKLEGLLQTDGSILARELKGEGRRATTTGTEVKVEGSVEMVNRNDAGDIVSVVVNGLPIGLRPLTKTEGVLNIGSGVEIDAVIAEGALLAGRIEAGREARPPDEEFEIEVAGAIEAIQLDDQGRIVGVTVNGLELLVGIPTELKGVLAVGETVEIKGAISGGTLRADEVEGRGQGSERPKRIGFELEGFIESLIYDEKGDVVGLVMDGNSIALEALTRVKGTLEPGAAVDIEGIVSEGQLVASKVELKEKESGTAG
jgi:hypothetical protein